MGATLLDEAELVVRRPVEDEVLAQQPHRHRGVFAHHLRRSGDGVPVAAHQLAHRRALADARVPFVVLLRKHRCSSSWGVFTSWETVERRASRNQHELYTRRRRTGYSYRTTLVGVGDSQRPAPLRVEPGRVFIPSPKRGRRRGLGGAGWRGLRGFHCDICPLPVRPLSAYAVTDDAAWVVAASQPCPGACE